ncbi:hypothetical protein WJX81_001499 [Elliptochloris bilobata]|uniref:Gamma carbonic anhydrase n=1 Tax=Elliptochloris bilobata TaxID=381761 RepID=A0AAW1SIT6_9CHLO
MRGAAGLARRLALCRLAALESQAMSPAAAVLGSSVPADVCIGDCDLFDKVSIWYGCVLRADLNAIMVGAFTNIQDRTIIHAARTSPTGLPAHTTVGRYVTVGQACLLRSTYIHDEVVIGDRCILLEGSLVEKHAVLAPGTVLPPGRLIPGGQLWAGNPARYVRDLTKDEKADIPIIAQGMFRHIDEHSSEFLPFSEAFPEAERLRALLAVKEKPAS